ncbi:MAG: 5-formyltetrahydrofolate cyclo-ligase [Omnitrophica WOR_2 bacterium GWF2_43_52]|nr:MAG: 5-formyltetrahydrofolate cyclo-ligase [Omnitrophica WOR_2 bacterium GWA2_44_7]OGX20517.1 MAG: 5-formyltetrahydrofolate cyclo-ligase [Omnitrophica WOR_2 bacterium GWF2_43_52]HAH20576.1 5-formyltetrahydrofolate cyclo-ligase [Candidatus Omnitrophota bacterium]HBG64258.1 5-formyltetrahydrofolate cyclo-ligase [Candidatus Omnitrophota bacterium]HCD38212.1 5-formyltetrahydrofolate cyclo-ligase [Candidatus Omnitrophota bacterium]
MYGASDKQELRKLMATKLKNQKEESVRRSSLKIKEKLFKLKVFKQAKTIMFYCALSSEVQTRLMMEEAFTLGKKIAVPIADIKAKKITPCLVTGVATNNFRKGAYSIDEPCCKKPIDPKAIDLCIVPGLAFDTKGNRLGRGMGYYDRFLSLLPESIPKIGLAFRFQVLKHLPHCLPHDIRVNKVLFA